MASLGLLVSVTAMAIITPLLPLQPPDRVQTKLLYQPPTAAPLWLDGFELDEAAIAASRLEITHLKSLRSQLQSVARSRAQTLGPTNPDTKEAREAVFRNHAEARDALYGPYLSAGFAELGPVGRLMVRIRHALFGRWELNSLCGRDLLGRDVLSRIFWGARVSLIVGLVAALVSLVIGVTYGAVAGYAGGLLDDAMMRVVDVLYSIPFIFVVIFILTILNADEVSQRMQYYGIGKITVFYFVVGAIYWLTMARVVRGQVISLKTEPFIEAAHSLGASQARIIFRHLLPNLLSIVLVYLTLTIPRVMLFEAFLSYLGLGVEPPDVSWGVLAREGIEVLTPVRIYWWLVVFPGFALATTLLALNFLGDGLRDALDPRLQRRR